MAIEEQSPPSSLREAHRLLSRTRIRAAAARLFYERGIAPVTMDDIAKAAQVSRSTLYVHYADKAELSADIASAYGDTLCALVTRLPSPMPSRPQIEGWIGDVAELIEDERIPTTLISDLSNGCEAPPSVQAIGERLEAALAARLPAFAHALADDRTRAGARGWGQAMMRHLGWACLPAPIAGDVAQARLSVAADIFEGFLRAMIGMEA
jgi:AcrR family transcriptional regulator